MINLLKWALIEIIEFILKLVQRREISEARVRTNYLNLDLINECQRICNIVIDRVQVNPYHQLKEMLERFGKMTEIIEIWNPKLKLIRRKTTGNWYWMILVNRQICEKDEEATKKVKDGSWMSIRLAAARYSSLAAWQVANSHPPNLVDP